MQRREVQTAEDWRSREMGHDMEECRCGMVRDGIQALHQNPTAIMESQFTNDQLKITKIKILRLEYNKTGCGENKQN